MSQHHQSGRRRGIRERSFGWHDPWRCASVATLAISLDAAAAGRMHNLAAARLLPLSAVVKALRSIGYANVKGDYFGASNQARTLWYERHIA